MFQRSGYLWWMSLALLCLTLATTSQQAHAQIDAITTASYDLRMAFTVNGMLSKVPVKAGDRVKAGDLLLALEDNEGLAMVLQYELKADSDLAIQSAEEQHRLAQVEARAIRQLLENKAATPIEMDRANVKAAIAALEVKHARQQLEEARHLLAQAKARHARYELYSPIDGVVDTLVARVGETVESLKPVIRVVNTESLYIDASVPTSQTLKLKAGDPVWVRFRILPDQPAVQGRILHLAAVADSASDTRIVRIETPNPYQLPAGGTVSISFDAPATQAAPSADAGPSPQQRGEK